MEAEFRNLDMFKIIDILIRLLAEQEGVEITYTVEGNGETRTMKTA